MALTEQQAENKAIADGILQQLGGHLFARMTGAKHFIAGNRTLSMTLPSNFATNGINKVVIALNDMDTYDMTFMRQRGFQAATNIAIIENVSDTMLAETFRETTGLETRMPRIVSAK